MDNLGDVRLSLVDCVVQFGALQAVGPITCHVKAGECVVLLGPSGCGKSTLLSALAGLQPIAAGYSARVGADTPPGFVFQDPNLMGWASAIENVALPLALAGVSHAEQNKRARDALTEVGLGSFAHARPKALSGGMAMRVALARALVTKPNALLLDEPFGAIDELGRRALNDLVHKAKKEAGVAVLFVTHSVEEAVYMGDTILVLSPRPGKIIGTINVPNVPRDTAFLLSDVFAKTLAQARRALAMGVDHEVD
jgi:NitT/TauT family transport system ATP-binding protein